MGLSGPNITCPKYHVRVEERVYISDEFDPGRKVIIPDLRISEIGRDLGPLTTPPAGVATLDVAEPITVTTLLDDEIHEAYLEVVDAELQGVVTVIEVLSPTNKVEGSVGRDSFLRKRQQVLRSPCHWVEIDLLRQKSPHVVGQVLDCEYLVYVSRADKRPQDTVWPIRLHQRLPVVAIPLRPGDKEVPLDVPAVFSAAYSRGAWDLAAQYQKDPIPPLPPQYVAWTEALLKSKGLR
jgi:hypothetical protein